MKHALRIGIAAAIVGAVALPLGWPTIANALAGNGGKQWTVYVGKATGTAKLAWVKDATASDYQDFTASVTNTVPTQVTVKKKVNVVTYVTVKTKVKVKTKVTVHGKSTYVTKLVTKTTRVPKVKVVVKNVAVTQNKTTVWYSGKGPIPSVQADADISLAMKQTSFKSVAALQAYLRHALAFSPTLAPMLGMYETGANATCLGYDAGSGMPTATCSGMNVFAGSLLAPGRTSTMNITVKNTGILPAKSFSVSAGRCQPGAASGPDLCPVTQVVLRAGQTKIWSGTLASFNQRGSVSLPPLQSGAKGVYSFDVTVDKSAGNTYQNLTAKLPVTWSFNG